MTRDNVCHCVVYSTLLLLLNMHLFCELRAVHEHERQPVAHITTWGLNSARVSNAETGFDVFKDH